MCNNLLFGAGSVADIVIAVLLVIAVIVGVIFGFMKNGLNNLFFIAKIVAIVLLVPVFNKIGFIASWITSLGGVLPDALSESLRNMLATAVISLAEAIVLFIVLSIVFAVIKWLLRKLTPKMGVMKLIDHILGGVVNFALYGVILLCLLGMVGTIGSESTDKALNESKFQSINFMQSFCDKNLNIGDFLEKLQGGVFVPEGGNNSLPSEYAVKSDGGEETVPFEESNGNEAQDV